MLERRREFEFYRVLFCHPQIFSYNMGGGVINKNIKKQKCSVV